MVAVSPFDGFTEELMNQSTLPLARASVPLVAAMLLSLFLPVHASANSVVLETAGPGWFSGPVHSTWIQVAPDAFGAPDHALWGLTELETALALFGSSPSDPRLIKTLTTDVSEINFANDVYNDTYAGTGWNVGAVLPPLFTPGDGNNQDDWGARFTRALHIQNSGWYNFGVLTDDGFALVIQVDGTDYKIFHDGLNPRDRFGYPQDLYLDPGDYNFSLEAYDHLSAGVVSLGVWREVPDAQIETPIVASEPGGLALIVIGIAGVGLMARRLKHRTQRKFTKDGLPSLV